jgi:hypothetical protein
MSLPVMEKTLVKAAGPGDRDRAYLKGGDVARRGPVHVIHDLPRLVVESLFGITDGLWGELAAGSHAAAGHAASARDPKRYKHEAQELRRLQRRHRTSGLEITAGCARLSPSKSVTPREQQ